MTESVESPEPIDPERRRLLLGGLGSAGLVALGPLLSGCDGRNAGATMRPTQMAGPLRRIGDLQPPDANGLRLPPGFSSRVVARAGQPPAAGSDYRWHVFPDGGATFATADGGWIYTSNSETVPGGVGALRFDASGAVVDAYPIQGGTVRNCAGGPTPWGAWLSCEEYEAGYVFECDPTGRARIDREANIRPALGTFTHEAAAVDPARGQIYMTEDRPDGGLYRFTPDQYPDLSSGLLEIAEIVGDDPATRRPVVWHEVPRPNPDVVRVTPADGLFDGFSEFPLEVVGTPTRYQVTARTPFDGGEGIWYHADIVYFTTKGDNRVWALDAAAQSIEIIYDDDLYTDPLLTGADNVTVSAQGEVLVAEDNGAEDMQIVAITPGRVIQPVVQVENQEGSEIAGPAFSPDGKRLYFSSQRGPDPTGILSDRDGDGITYEVTGPFFRL